MTAAGNMLQLLLSPEYGEYEFKWGKVYGLVYRIKGCLGVRHSSFHALRPGLTALQQDRLMVSDPTAVQYIVNSPDFVLTNSFQALAYWLYGKKSLTSRTGITYAHYRRIIA